MQTFWSWAGTKIKANSFNDPNVQKNALQNPQYNPYGSNASWVGRPPTQQEADKAGAKFGGEFTGRNATAYIGIPKGVDGTGVAYQSLGLPPLSPVEIAGLSSQAVFSKGGDAGQAMNATFNGASFDSANQLR